MRHVLTRRSHSGPGDDSDRTVRAWPGLFGWRRLPVVLAASLGIALSVIGYYVVDSWERNNEESEFRQRSAEIAALLQHSLNQSIDLLFSIRDLYAVGGDVDRQTFQNFARSMLERHPEITALEWIPRVSAEQRADYEEAMRRQGFSDFRITERSAQGEMVPAGRRDVYYPVQFIEPFAGNEAALGFDLGSNDRRLRALQLARDSGTAVATARISLVQGSGQQYGFLIFVPIYSLDGPHDSPDARRENLRGFGLGVYRIDTVVERPLQRFLTPSGIDFYILDASSETADRFLYFHPSRLREEPAQPLPKEQFLTGLFATRMIEVAGRNWGILFKPAPGHYDHFRWTALGALLAGLLLTAALSIYLFSMLGRTREIERLVTERTEELTRSNEALARSNRDLEEFAFVASHDLQEPLRKVQAFGDRLARLSGDQLTGDAKDCVARMLDGARRMQTMVTDLLTFSRFSSQAPTFKPVDLGEIAQEVVDDLEVQIAEAKGRVEIGTLPKIEADPRQMRHLLQNLTVNALKFRRDGVAPVVRLSGEIRNGDKRAVGPNGAVLCDITVVDNGIGFDQKYESRIFELFQRLHDRSRYPGTGLGLALCRKIAEFHGGTIAAIGEPGQGSTFKITLPVQQRKAARRP